MSFALSLLALRASVVLLLAAAAVAALRRASASARHAALLLAVAALLALPLLSAFLPRWEMPVLSAPPPAVPAAIATAPASVAAGRFADRSPRTAPGRNLVQAEPEAARPSRRRACRPGTCAAADPSGGPFTTWLLVAWAAAAAGLVQLLAAALLGGGRPRRLPGLRRGLAPASPTRPRSLTRPVRLCRACGGGGPRRLRVPGRRGAAASQRSAWPEDRRRALLISGLPTSDVATSEPDAGPHRTPLYWPHPRVVARAPAAARPSGPATISSFPRAPRHPTTRPCSTPSTAWPGGPWHAGRGRAVAPRGSCSPRSSRRRAGVRRSA
jgi:hypothetical protein